MSHKMSQSVLASLEPLRGNWRFLEICTTLKSLGLFYYHLMAATFNWNCCLVFYDHTTMHTRVAIGCWWHREETPKTMLEPVIYAYRRSIWSWYDSAAITISTRRIPNYQVESTFINFLIMTKKSSRSYKKSWCQVFFFLFLLMSFFVAWKLVQKKTSSRTMKRAFKKAIKLPGQAVGLWKALEKEDDSNFQLSALLLASKGAKRNLESSQFAKTPSCLIIQAFWCSKLVNS